MAFAGVAVAHQRPHLSRHLMAAEILLKITPGSVGALCSDSSGTAAEGYARLRAGALNTSVGQLSTSSLLKLRT